MDEQTMLSDSNNRKNFSTEQLEYIHLSLEQALLVPYLQTIEVTPEMLEEQKERIRLAEKSVRRPSWKLFRKWGGIRYFFSLRRFFYGSPNFTERDPDGEWLEAAVEWAIDNYPDEYEKECLECMKLGLRPYPGLILRRVHF